MLGPGCAGTLFRRELDRWTWDATEGTKHAAMPVQRAKHGAASAALVEVEAGISGHDFLALRAASGAREHRPQSGSRHGGHGWKCRRTLKLCGANEAQHSVVCV